MLLDLNAAPLAPIETIARLKGDADLAAIPIVGFVSHVQADVIAAARAAGIDEVMARSAFVTRLPELLSPVTAGPTLDEVLAARARVSGRVRRTPLVRSDWLSAAGGGEVLLKLESLQVTHSFKSRGALNALLALLERLPPGSEPPLLVTASAGNHGRALAWAAEQAGVKVVIFTPRSAPATKLEAIRRHGADLRAEAATLRGLRAAREGIRGANRRRSSSRRTATRTCWPQSGRSRSRSSRTALMSIGSSCPSAGAAWSPASRPQQRR